MYSVYAWSVTAYGWAQNYCNVQGEEQSGAEAFTLP